MNSVHNWEPMYLVQDQVSKRSFVHSVQKHVIRLSRQGPAGGAVLFSELVAELFSATQIVPDCDLMCRQSGSVSVAGRVFLFRGVNFCSFCGDELNAWPVQLCYLNVPVFFRDVLQKPDLQGHRGSRLGGGDGGPQGSLSPQRVWRLCTGGAGGCDTIYFLELCDISSVPVHRDIDWHGNQSIWIGIDWLGLYWLQYSHSRKQQCIFLRAVSYIIRTGTPRCR